MKKVSPYDKIPKSHANMVVDLYLQLKWQQWRAEAFHLEFEQNAYESSILDLPEADVNKIAGKPPLGGCVFATVHDAFIFHPQLLTSREYLFRGHSDARWRLTPSKRRLIAPETLEYYERQRIRFLAACRRAGLDMSTEIFETACQHYGIPTYLLDLTDVIEIAAFFAIPERSSSTISSDPLDHIGCIWVFQRKWLEEQSTLISRSEYFPHPLANQRIERQQGSFVRVDTEECTEALHRCGQPILFYRRGASNYKLRIIIPRASGQDTDQPVACDITRQFLFPADEDDAISKLSQPITEEITKRKEIHSAIDRCVIRCGDLILQRSDAMRLLADSRTVPETLVTHESPWWYLWAIEYYVLHDAFARLASLVKSPLIDLSQWPEWQDLIFESAMFGVLQCGGILSVEYGNLLELLQFALGNVASGPFLVRLLKNSGDLSDDSRANLRRWIVDTVAADDLHRFEVTRSLDALNAIVSFFWDEDDAGRRAKISELIEENERFSTHLSNWPPIMRRTKRIEPLWTYKSDVMVWDLDVSDSFRRVAAISTDHNVYLFDFDGNRVGRFDLGSPGVHLRFLNDTVLVATDRSGTVWWLVMQNDGNALSLLRKECLYELWDHFGCPFNLDVNEKSGAVTACYGNNPRQFGCVAVYTADGTQSYYHEFPVSVLQASSLKPYDTFPMIVTATAQSGEMSVGLLRDDAISWLLCNRAAVRIAGFSYSTREPIVSEARNYESCSLLRITPNGEIIPLVVGTEFVLFAYLNEQSDILLCSSMSLAEPKSASITCYTASGKLRWKQELTKQAFTLKVDERNSRFFISSLGQGNVYAFSFSGDPLFCARVRHAPMCFGLSRNRDILFVGSGDVSAIPTKI